MNDNFTNDERDEIIAQKLSHVAEQTNARSQFAAELEEKLRTAHRPKTRGFAAFFRQISPTLRWVALMVLLALVLSWSIKTLIPTPQPAVNGTPTLSEVSTSTPAPNILPNETPTSSVTQTGYDFRGAKLYLEHPLPASPVQAHVYLLHKEDQPVTREQAQALAERFGIQGEVYTEPDYIFNTTDYKFSDGKQSLSVYSQRFFSYVGDMAKTSKLSTNTPNDNAEAKIREFLQARGFDFSYRIFLSDFFDGYIVQPLAPDTIPMQYESFTPPAMLVMLGENGEVLRLDAMLMEYDTAPIGEYGIISAQEAFEKLLDDSLLTGKTEFMDFHNDRTRDWYRSYPDNQPVTTYGYITKYPAADPGKPALILIEGIPVFGNIDGLESLDNYTFIKATGQYSVENGIRKFNVESWDRKVQEMPFSGILSRQGDQIILTRDDGSGKQYALIDPPADPPLNTKVPDTMLEVYGALEDGKISWTFIRLFEDYGRGGGGGGGVGLGFYKLNLSGTPVAFPPSPVPQPAPTNVLTGAYIIQEDDTLSAIAQKFGTSVDTLMQLNGLTDSSIYIGQTLYVPMPEPAEQQVEDLRGYLFISIHNKSDGTSSKEYTLEVAQETGGSSVYTMEGSILDELDVYNGLPILITGTINISGKLVVESYKIPYPNLHFQILKGTQRAEQVGGQNVVVFTTEDGTSFVEFMFTNNIPNDRAFTGQQGDLIQQEVLILPDETFGGIPVAHIYQSAIVQENGPAMEPRANQISVYNEPNDPMISPDYTPPNLTITQVELVYYGSNPYYQINDPNYSQRSPYLQPVWHFHGRFDDGSTFDAVIQALKEVFLLPELVPGAGVG